MRGGGGGYQMGRGGGGGGKSSFTPTKRWDGKRCRYRPTQRSTLDAIGLLKVCVWGGGGGINSFEVPVVLTRET